MEDKEPLTDKKSELKKVKGLRILSPYLTIKRRRERKMSKTMETTYYKNYKELAEDYFGFEDFKVGENAPKLSKQLSKLNIKYTQGELQAFQELLTAVFSNEKAMVYSFEFSSNLPGYNNQDSWAFGGSCNSQGDVGEFTSEILDTLEESRYCYIYDDMDEPVARFYYLEKNGVYALADLYSDKGHGYYLAPQILLCVAFGIKLEQFKLFSGVLINRDNTKGFWSNLASPQYKHFTNGEFPTLYFDEYKVNEVYYNNDCVYSSLLERYITESELEDGDFIYCNNVDDFDDRDNTFFCEGCQEYHSLSGHYVETEDYEKFCSVECAYHLDYVMTEADELVDIDEAFCCEDCWRIYLSTEGYEGADGCLYCESCVCDHLDEE